MIGINSSNNSNRQDSPRIQLGIITAAPDQIASPASQGELQKPSASNNSSIADQQQGCCEEGLGQRLGDYLLACCLKLWHNGVNGWDCVFCDACNPLQKQQRRTGQQSPQPQFWQVFCWPSLVELKRVLAHASVSFCFSFLAVVVVSLVQYQVIARYYVRDPDLPLNFVAYSLGASCVLLFDAIDSPLAQPRNVIGSHLLTSFLGICIRLVLFDYPLLATPLSVASAIAVMRLTRTTHPPGGATALMAATHPNLPRDAHAFIFIPLPMLCGSVTLVFLAYLLNNLVPSRNYPKKWM